MRARILLAGVLIAALVWAFRTPERPKPLFQLKDGDVVAAEWSTRFRKEACGTLQGVVRWRGAVPEVEPFQPHKSFFTPEGLAPIPNPNAIHAEAGLLANAVVFLRRVDPAEAKPWSHEPVTVTMHNYDLHLQQGPRRGHIGFVKQGESVNLVSRDATLHAIRGHGVTYFTQMLAQPNASVRRTFGERGIVELMSGGEYVWARGYLFVAEHPYYTLTDAKGEFTLEDVPAGAYELVCWKPNWHIAQRERDPELLVHTRLRYHPPVEQTQSIHVRAGQKTTVAPWTLDATMFAPK